MFKGDVEDTSGNYSVKYSGYCIELFQLIVSKLNKDRTELGLDPIEYRLYDVTQYGSFIDEKWTGAVGELVYGVGEEKNSKTKVFFQKCYSSTRDTSIDKTY